MKRRDFCKLTALTAVGTATMAAGCATPQRRIESRVFRPENNPVDEEVWYNTACDGCGSACGVMVRVIDGRAKKIEGNPDHPVSGGKLCPRGNMGLQFLYHPDRLAHPQRRTGDRGSNTFERLDQDQAIRETAQRLNEAAGRGDGAVLFITGSANGHTGALVDRLARALRSPGRIALESMPQAAQRLVNRNLFGNETLAEYDIDHADYVLSFSSHILEAGPSPVRYGRGYGEMRQGRPTRRGRMVHLEPRLSLTAANADRWIPIRPGTEGAFALGVLHLLAGGNIQRPQGAPDLGGWQGQLGQFTPQGVEEITGVRAGTVEEVAREFASVQAALAIPGEMLSGYSNAVPTITAIQALNIAANNVGREGGVRFAPPLPLQESLQAVPINHDQLRQQIDRMRNKQVGAVVLVDVDPLLTLPGGLGLADALAGVPFVLSFATLQGESTRYSDIVFPALSYLESWDTRVSTGATNRAVLTIGQPVVAPFRQFAMSAGDWLLAIAKAMGGSAAGALTWNSFADYLRETTSGLLAASGGTTPAGSPDQAFAGILQRGGWWSEPSNQAVNVNQGAVQGGLAFEPPRFEGDEGQFPFHLQVYESAAFGDGRYAALPWAQEFPDPMTTVVWGSWIEINPHTAEEMGIHEGDLVDVESPAGKLQVPAYLYPGIAPEVVAMPIGQGQTSGTWGANRGVSPMSIVAPVADSQAKGLAYAATRVKIAKAAGRGRLITIEGQSERRPGRAFFEGSGA